MKKTIIIFLLCLSMIIILTPVDVVTADSADWFLLASFDDALSGVQSGTSGYFDFEGNAYFKTSTGYTLPKIPSDAGANNSLRVYGSAANGYGWCNLTSQIEYIGILNFSFLYHATLVHMSEDLDMNFIDSYGHEVIKINMYFEHGTDIDYIKWNDVTTGWQTVYTGASLEDDRLYLIFTHLGLNTFNVSIYDDSFILKGSYEGAGAYAGVYTSFSSIYFEGDVSDPAAGVYFDNFYMGTTSGSGTTPTETEVYCSGNPELYDSASPPSGYTTPQYVEILFTYEQTINITMFEIFMHYDLIGGTTFSYSDFGLYVNNYYRGQPTGYDEQMGGGILGSNVVTRIFWRFEDKPVNIISQKPYFVFRSSIKIYDLDLGLVEYNDGLQTRYHSSFSLVQNGILDGQPFHPPIPERYDLSCCYYYTIPEDGGGYDDEKINDSDLPDDKTRWGDPEFNNTFLEFYKPDSHCYYRVGDYAELHYWLTDEYYTGSNHFYYYVIYQENVFPFDTEVYRGIVPPFNTANDSREHYTTGYKFIREGKYYVWTYNSTSDGSDINEIIHWGGTITVCKSTGGGGSGGNLPGGDDFGLSTLPVFYKIIIAVMIILCMTLSPLAIGIFISKAGMNVNIPSLLYIGFFFFGIGISCEIGVLDWAVFFIILFGLIIAFAILWLHGKDTSKGG